MELRALPLPPILENTSTPACAAKQEGRQECWHHEFIGAVVGASKGQVAAHSDSRSLETTGSGRRAPQSPAAANSGADDGSSEEYRTDPRHVEATVDPRRA